MKYENNERTIKMTGHENVFKGSSIKHIKNVKELTAAMLALIPCNLTNNDVVFICIGTDRSTGDSLGPLVGTQLRKRGYKNVYGTLDDPVHALNLKETLNKLPKDKKVIAIDACLGQFSSVGTFAVVNGSLKPGAGVKKELPEVGDYSIMGVVNVGGFMEYEVIQGTRLARVMKMARDITRAIYRVFPLEKKKKIVDVDTYNLISIK
jgi:putative sporulation protein YyaC